MSAEEANVAAEGLSDKERKKLEKKAQKEAKAAAKAARAAQQANQNKVRARAWVCIPLGPLPFPQPCLGACRLQLGVFLGTSGGDGATLCSHGHTLFFSRHADWQRN